MLSGSTLSALDVPSISAALAIVGLAILLISCLLSYSRLRHVPGPRSGAFSKLWMVRATASGQMVRSPTLRNPALPARVS